MKYPNKLHILSENTKEINLLII